MAVQHEQREQHYSLRWNNHQSHVLNAFDSLLQNEALVDCTLVCEDTSIRAHKVVLSACSPYFQKIFTDNPCKHPIIVLKDVRGWEVQCIVDFMYKGETSVPEAQLNSLIKAAEGLKVRGLTSSDHLPPGLTNHSRHSSRHNSPMPAGAAAAAQAGGSAPPYAGRSVHYSPSPARYPPSDEPHAKVPHLSTTDQSSPMSLTTHDPDARRSAEDRCSAASSASARASPGPAGSGPRRKQARPRRRSGDSIGNASLDLSKAESPTFRKSPSHLDDATPENLSMKRPSSSPAINLVKTETLMEDGRQGLSDNISEASSTADRERAIAAAAAAAAAAVSTPSDDHKSTTPSSSDHFLSAFHSNGLQQHEHEARVEALQALNYMARGMGLNTLPHPHAHPLAGHPGVNGAPHLAPHHMLSSSTASGVIGRPTSTPSTGTSAFNGEIDKTGFDIQRISIDRTKMSEEEAFEHAIEMIQTRQMGFRKAADFFSVSKWKLYKTARKRGIYAEIKKQNQAQALTKVPTNVQHFADMGVYKQLKKKTHLTKDGLFPHLPGHTEAESRKVFKAPTNNNNNNNNNNNLTSLVNLQKKMLEEAKLSEERNSNGEVDPDHLSDDEDHHRTALPKPETMIIRPALPSSTEANEEDDEDIDIDEEEDERVLVINHRENETASPEEDEDSGREDSA